MTPKLLYTLFWYNQACILLRYAYSHYKLINGAPSSTPKPSALALCKMIGLEESENLSNTLKFILNFSLQLFLIILIFKERNQELFKKFQQELTKENIRRSFRRWGVSSRPSRTSTSSSSIRHSTLCPGYRTSSSTCR